MPLNYDQQQHTAEWHRARLGHITGSKVGLLMKKPRTKGETFTATATAYLYQLAGERCLNPELIADGEMLFDYLEQTSPTSRAMRFGTEQEPNAREAYEKATGRRVTEVGLCQHPKCAALASSPDGVVIDEHDGPVGCIEIKCPGVAAFVQYAKEAVDNGGLRAANPDYFYQCQAHMAVTGCQWCDFVIYCPYMAVPLHVSRITRDEAVITEMEERATVAEDVIKKFAEALK